MRKILLVIFSSVAILAFLQLQNAYGDATFIARLGEAGSGSNQYDLSVWDFELDSDNNVYILSGRSPSLTITKYSYSGEFLTKWRDSGSTSDFCCIDVKNSLVYAKQRSSDRIKVYDSSGTPLRTVTLSSSPGAIIDLEVDSRGNIYLMTTTSVPSSSGDTNYVGRIAKYDSEGNFVRDWVAPSPHEIEEGLSWRTLLQTDSHDNVFAFSSYRNTILKFDSDGNLLNTYTIENVYDLPYPAHSFVIDSRDNIYTQQGRYTNFITKFDSSMSFVQQEEIPPTLGNPYSAFRVANDGTYLVYTSGSSDYRSYETSFFKKFMPSEAPPSRTPTPTPSSTSCPEPMPCPRCPEVPVCPTTPSTSTVTSPTLTLSKEVVPGKPITVFGSGFPPNTKVKMSLIPPTGKKITLGTATTSGSGDFSLKVTIPKDLQTGIHQLSVDLPIIVQKEKLVEDKKQQESKKSEIKTPEIKEPIKAKEPTKQVAPAKAAQPDSDADGVPDYKDNCTKIYNPEQTDNDFDGLGDACDSTPFGEKKIEPVTPSPQSPSDTDKDGITDSSDKCPKEAETKNGYQDDDGCPDIAPTTVAPIKPKIPMPLK